MDEPTGLNRPDRDLLISLDTKVTLMAADIKEMKDDTKERLAYLETEKLDKDIFNQEIKTSVVTQKDHELRLRRLELWGAMVAGGLALFQVLLKYFIK
jgi:hypothetical protein